MNAKHIALTVLAGVAAFLVVGVAVTELLAPRIEFSLFLGLPAGLLAAVIAMVAVAVGFGRDEAASRRVAVAVGTYGAVFLATAVAVGSVVGQGVLASMLVGVVAGLAAGGWTYVRDPSAGRRHGPNGA